MSNMNRREILKGMSLGAGTLLLSPVLSQLQAQANGSPQRPKRFVFVVEGNGLNPDQIQPLGISRPRQHQRTELRDIPLADHQLPRALEPLQPFKNRMTIVQGLSGRVCGGGHSNNFGALGVYSSKQGPAGQTIDMALAQLIPGIFPQVGLGISDRAEHSIIYNCSAIGPGRAMPTQCNPMLAYNNLFGSVAQGSARQAYNAQNNLLDFMREDVRRVENRLAAPERERLGHYLEAYESLSQRQSRLNEVQSTLRRHAPVVNDKFRSDVETDRLDAQFDIASAALIGGLTNVVTLASGAGDPYFSVRFRGLGIEVGKHTIGHGGSYNGMTWAEMATTIRRFHMELIARLATRLDAVREGDGTMLDNTLIIYLSDAAEGHHSRCWEWPFVLIGNLGGRLRTGGRYLEYPYYGNRQHRTIANLYTTFLHAAGANRQFGMADPGLRDIDQSGPLSELLA